MSDSPREHRRHLDRRDRERERDRERGRDRNQNRERERDRDRERDRGRDRDRHYRHSDAQDDRHRSPSRDRDRDRRRHLHRDSDRYTIHHSHTDKHCRDHSHGKSRSQPPRDQSAEPPPHPTGSSIPKSPERENGDVFGATPSKRPLPEKTEERSKKPKIGITIKLNRNALGAATTTTTTTTPVVTSTQNSANLTPATQQDELEQDVQSGLSEGEVVEPPHAREVEQQVAVPSGHYPDTPDQSKEPSLSREATPADIPRSLEPTPELEDFALETSDIRGRREERVAEEEPAAADYDPTFDRQDEAKRHEIQLEAVCHNHELQSPGQDDGVDDMFADADDDDMFADPAPAPKPRATTGAIPVLQKGTKAHDDSNLTSNWDDEEGYYRVIIGEMLDNGRYHIQANLGKGMFSSVVKAFDSVEKREVAIKIIRNNEIMYKAGMKEMGILKTLNSSDMDDKKHLIRLLCSFEFRGHLCLVFEGMSKNLREVLKRFGRDAGINITAIRAYAQQIFLALLHLRRNNVLHADLKPDNILVNDGRNVLKVCDLGSASDVSENAITPYLASRFYRAPELIIGLQYDFAVDMWSVGCTLFELYTGRILFPGSNNNQMLKVIMQTRGKIPHKLLRKGVFTPSHFDDQMNFLSRETDSLTGKPVVKSIPFSGRVVRDLKSRVFEYARGEDKGVVGAFVDLLEKCLNLNPDKRITPAEALRHPFIRGN
ncbi:kinase-like domain-containing protein [Lipomyces tetrasporus]